MYTLIAHTRVKMEVPTKQSAWEKLAKKPPKNIEITFENIISKTDIDEDLATALLDVHRNRGRNIRYSNALYKLAEMYLAAIGDIVSLNIQKTVIH